MQLTAAKAEYSIGGSRTGRAIALPMFQQFAMFNAKFSARTLRALPI